MVRLLNMSGVVDIPFAGDVLTTIREAVTNRQALNEHATGWVLHPADMETIDLLTDDQGRYFGDDTARVFRLRRRSPGREGGRERTASAAISHTCASACPAAPRRRRRPT